MRIEYTAKIGKGISQKNRILLDRLNREAKIPFGISNVSNVLSISIKKARRLVAYWVSRGWLVRIKKGLFSTVPLGSIDPYKRKEEPWIVANAVFEPCYIGGWSACEYWGLTDQIFKDIVVFTLRKLRKRELDIQDTKFIIRNISKEKLFGMKPVWKGQAKINVSDPSRTIADILNEPYLGGGIRNVASIFGEYLESEDRDLTKLTAYILKLGNGTIFKRLGFLLESLKINLPELIEICKKNMTSGYSVLDPSLPSKGKLLRRWSLLINSETSENK